ncbi:hypothetical protein EJB05_26806, partial [Eragrostis curvula]
MCRGAAALWVTQVCGWVAATRSLRVLAALLSPFPTSVVAPTTPHHHPPQPSPSFLSSFPRTALASSQPSAATGRRRIAGEASRQRRRENQDPPEPRWLYGVLDAVYDLLCGVDVIDKNNLGMVADTESSDSLPGSSNATADKPINGPPDQRSQERTPKKNHKAEREKLKRDQLNDLFLELSSMLDLDRQNSGKASVLGDAARVLRDLITQVESLRKEQSALLAERQYVSSEKNELLEENTTIKARISELQNELRTRMGNNNINLSSLGMSHPMANATNPGLATQPMQHQIWSSIPNLSSVAMTHSTNTVSPLHSQQHRPAAGQVHASRPQELQLFPGPSSSPEHECSHIRSTPASTSSLTDSLPGQLQLSLPQSSQERSSNCVSRSRREQKHG